MRVALTRHLKSKASNELSRVGADALDVVDVIDLVFFASSVVEEQVGAVHALVGVGVDLGRSHCVAWARAKSLFLAP